MADIINRHNLLSYMQSHSSVTNGKNIVTFDDCEFLDMILADMLFYKYDEIVFSTNLAYNRVIFTDDDVIPRHYSETKYKFPDNWNMTDCVFSGVSLNKLDIGYGSKLYNSITFDSCNIPAPNVCPYFLDGADTCTNLFELNIVDCDIHRHISMYMCSRTKIINLNISNSLISGLHVGDAQYTKNILNIDFENFSIHNEFNYREGLALGGLTININNWSNVACDTLVLKCDWPNMSITLPTILSTTKLLKLFIKDSSNTTDILSQLHDISAKGVDLKIDASKGAVLANNNIVFDNIIVNNFTLHNYMITNSTFSNINAKNIIFEGSIIRLNTFNNIKCNKLCVNGNTGELALNNYSNINLKLLIALFGANIYLLDKNLLTALCPNLKIK